MKIFDENNNLIDHENIEHIEQELAKQWIKPEDRVLELGARYGSVSIVTNQIIRDKSTHYVVEPDETVWSALESNMKLNDCDFNIVKGIIGTKRYRLQGTDYEKTSTIDTSYGTPQVKSFDLPNVDFDTLIVDCEGFLEEFYDDNKPLFSRLKKMIIECDCPHKCDYPRLIDEFENLGFKRAESIDHYGLMYHVFTRQPKVLFCSLSDRQMEFSLPMMNELENYCNRHNYKCVIEDKSLDETRAQSWSKIKLLQREMLSNPDIDLIVWYDDDILITNPELKFEELIKDYDFTNILLSEEVHPPFNCGVIVCKNNMETFDYLQHIWDLCEQYPQYKTTPNWEQEIFHRDNNRSKIKTIPHTIIQSFYREFDLPEHLKWKPEHFAAHITGNHLSIGDRVKLRNQILNIMLKNQK